MYGTIMVVFVKDPVGNKLTSFHGLSVCNSTIYCAYQTVISITLYYVFIL